MAGLRTKTLGIYEKDTGRSIHCNIEGYPYTLIWSAAAKPVRFVCIEPWQSLPAAETDPQAWEQRAAAACLAPGESWQTTLSTTFDRQDPPRTCAGCARKNYLQQPEKTIRNICCG